MPSHEIASSRYRLGLLPGYAAPGHTREGECGEGEVRALSECDCEAAVKQLGYAKTTHWGEARPEKPSGCFGKLDTSLKLDTWMIADFNPPSETGSLPDLEPVSWTPICMVADKAPCVAATSTAKPTSRHFTAPMTMVHSAYPKS